jgi:hypothetical protein
LAATNQHSLKKGLCKRSFVVSIDTAHIRSVQSADPKTARDFEIVIARCGRGGRGMPPGHYFATTNTSQLEMRARTLQALQFEGYSGHGEVTVLSDGAEIMKRLPKALPKPTTHIIDWFHLAMKIRPMQQIADHIVGSRSRSGQMNEKCPANLRDRFHNRHSNLGLPVSLNKACFPISFPPENSVRLPDGIDIDRSVSTGWRSSGDSKVSSS